MEKTLNQTSKTIKKIPSFKRQNRFLKKRVGRGWRRPRGIDNKQRLQRRGQGSLPKIGYRQPRSQRGIHPSGFSEVLVHNERELSLLEKSRQAARISSGVGGRKRSQILKKALELGIKVLN